MSDPFGRAVRDHERGDRTEPLVQCDGEERRGHPIEEFYFGAFDPDRADHAWVADRLDGPLLDMGAGAGRDALFFQERFETVAIEVSDHLVETMERRGVEDARRGDMFALCESFDRDRFRSALAYGTQLGLAGSMRGLREFLGDLAHVTTPDATAVVDCYDPDRPAARELLGFRDDPTPGLAHRAMWFEYGDETGAVLLFRLFSPDRLREAAAGTGWTVEEVRYGDEESSHYAAALAKQ
ncbi:class I SAM-dependent methyltransferase [Halostella sp. JP-L12]|uniref:class I SAM-dependent methyltransferase n=1 Tax=Halostella TaxID=1843185 RepID=UPI000EF823CB|nr:MULTISPECIES: class I SAM-dependent methyltransferase [Halostella]NHN46874.1 class I SAM-dependent methyltransferase [Halostella sp. JP-L12]